MVLLSLLQNSPITLIELNDYFSLLQTPLEFDDNVVLRQLRYTGMLATINIRKSGYNYRLKFQVS